MINFGEMIKPDLPGEVITCECLNEDIINASSIESYSTEGITNCPDGAPPAGMPGMPKKCNKVIYDKTILTAKSDTEPTRAQWSFFLNGDEVNVQIINDFISKIVQVQPQDKVIIHGPSRLFTDDAEVLVSAIIGCASKDITISSPYILDSGAAYLFTAASHIVTCVGAVAFIGCPCIGCGGKPFDAKNGYEAQMYRHMHILNGLKSIGFINDADMKHIIQEQGQIALHGQKYINIINQFNNR